MSVHESSSHPLDYPIWTALTTTQQALAEGDARARRYPIEITPFAATADMSPESFAALGALDVGDRDDDDFELQVHRRRCVGFGGSGVGAFPEV